MQNLTENSTTGKISIDDRTAEPLIEWARPLYCDDGFEVLGVDSAGEAIVLSDVETSEAETVYAACQRWHRTLGGAS